MKFYIDPGTGSMLFAILIGIIGALNYVVRVGIVKLRFILSGGKKVESNKEKIPYVIFSDNKTYWNVFDPICKEFDRRGIDVVYMTASEDDPVFQCPYKHIKGEFLGKGNMAYAKLNFINASIVISTTPGLDVYQWKRSKDVQCYVHVLHASGEVTLYRMFGLDYYDSLLLGAEYQVDGVRELEHLRNLPAKEIEIVGVPYMDEMLQRLKESDPTESQERTVLLAPSWGKNAIFSRYGTTVLEELIKTGYHIIVRPHPQTFRSEKEMIEKIMKEYPESDQIEWNMDTDNFDALKRADIMVSDFSGVIFDFALVYDKPVIYSYSGFDKSPYDAWWLEGDIWKTKALPQLGLEIDEESVKDIKKIIDTCLEDEIFEMGRKTVRETTWKHIGEGTQRTVDWLVKKHEQIIHERENEEK